MTTTCPFRPNQIAYVNLFLGISSILDNLNSWRIENTESSRRVYSNMRSTREILSGHSAPYFHDDRLHRHDDRLRYCELPNVWHINIDFTAMKTVVAAIFCAPHGKTTFSTHSFYPWNNRSQNIYHGFASYFCVFLTRSNQQKSLFRWQDFFLRAFQLH